MRGMHSRMHEREAPVPGDMGVVPESEAAMHPNEASVQSALSAARSNVAQPHIEEAQLHEDDVDALRNLSPMQRVMARMGESHARLQSHDAFVHRGWTCLHMSYTHVHRDISVVH